MATCRSIRASEVTTDAAGNTLVVWSQEGNVWANRYTVTSGWGIAEILSNANRGYLPQVAADAAGNAIVVWWDEGALK